MKDIYDIAHRMAWRYKKSSDPHHSDTYTFNDFTLLQFAQAIRNEALEEAAKKCEAFNSEPVSHASVASEIRATKEKE